VIWIEKCSLIQSLFVSIEPSNSVSVVESFNNCVNPADRNDVTSERRNLKETQPTALLFQYHFDKSLT